MGLANPCAGGLRGAEGARGGLPGFTAAGTSWRAAVQRTCAAWSARAFSASAPSPPLPSGCPARADHRPAGAAGCPICAFRTRFSSRRKAIASRCSASSDASRPSSNTWSGITRQLYRRRNPFQFSDNTGSSYLAKDVRCHRAVVPAQATRGQRYASRPSCNLCCCTADPTRCCTVDPTHAFYMVRTRRVHIAVPLSRIDRTREAEQQ